MLGSAWVNKCEPENACQRVIRPPGILIASMELGSCWCLWDATLLVDRINPIRSPVIVLAGGGFTLSVSNRVLDGSEHTTDLSGSWIISRSAIEMSCGLARFVLATGGCGIACPHICLEECCPSLYFIPPFSEPHFLATLVTVGATGPVAMAVFRVVIGSVTPSFILLRDWEYRCGTVTEDKFTFVTTLVSTRNIF